MIVFKTISCIWLFSWPGMCEWLSEYVLREADCILYGMFNGKKKLNCWTPLQFAFIYCPALCDCHLQNCTAQFSAIIVPHFSVTSTESESIVYWTQAYAFSHVKGRNPKLWQTQKHTVMGARQWRAALIFSLPNVLTLLWPFFLMRAQLMCIVTKDLNASMSKKKCFKNSTSCVFA